MKLNKKHFKIQINYRHIMLESWQEYFAIKNKKEKIDYDKFFLKEFRKQLKENEFKAVVTHIPSNIKDEFIVSEINRNNLMEILLDRVRIKRSEMRKFNIEKREFDGAKYVRVGGVMDQSDVIRKLGPALRTNDPWYYKKPKAITNYVGIELEFLNDGTQNTQTIGQAFSAAGLGKYVRVTTDASCGFEVQVLLEENSFEDKLKAICQVLLNLNARVDDRCGTHIHLDMRSRDVKQVYKNFFMTQNFLKKFLNKSRKKNRYCKFNSKPTFDEQLQLKKEVDYNTYRRHAINVDSFEKHRTLELRMYQGSLNVKELVPWIKLLVKVANFKGHVPEKISTLKQANKVYEFETDLSVNLKDRILDMFKKEVGF